MAFQVVNGCQGDLIDVVNTLNGVGAAKQTVDRDKSRSRERPGSVFLPNMCSIFLSRRQLWKERSFCRGRIVISADAPGR